MKTYPKSEPKGQPTKTKKREKTSNEILHISMCFDEKYLTPFTVLLTSILKNNGSNPIQVHAIATGLSGREKNEIKNLLNEHGGDISYYQVSDVRIKYLHVPKTSPMSISAYHRLCIAGMVPANVEKLLYLDTDIIVNNSLTGIFNTEMGNFAAGAVTEFSSKTVRPELGITSADMYFNSGVLLINVKEWNRQQISERAISFILNNPEKLIWGDQDALNAVFAGNYLRLGAENNVIHSDVPTNLNKAEFRKFVEDKTIIHYTLLRHKPWNPNCKSEIRFLYFEYLWQSPCWQEIFGLYWAFKFLRLKKSLVSGRTASLNVLGEMARRLGILPQISNKTV